MVIIFLVTYLVNRLFIARTLYIESKLLVFQLILNIKYVTQLLG